MRTPPHFPTHTGNVCNFYWFAEKAPGLCPSFCSQTRTCQLIAEDFTDDSDKKIRQLLKGTFSSGPQPT